MKKITLILFALFTCWQINAQVSSYSFAESTETYAQITGTTSTATGDDGTQTNIPIGFTFNYGGVNYTAFGISTNGIIRLGSNATDTAIASGWTNGLSNTAANRPLIAVLWDDNNMTGGEIRYSLTGVAPNQVLTVNWHNSKIGGGGSTGGSAVSALLRLYQTSNVIEIVYSNPYTTTNTVSASVGLNDASSFLSVTPAATSTVSSATANNAINAATMANLAGKKLTFSPPSCSAPTGFVVSNLTPTSATISWNAAVPVPSTGYQYYYSNVNTAPSGAGTPVAATTDNLSGLTVNTTYYVWLRSDCGGGTFSAWAGPFTFATPCNPYTVPYFEGFESGYTHNVALAGCISQASVTGTQVWTANNTLTTYNRAPRTGAFNAFLQYSNEDWMFIPIDLVGGTSYRVSLYARQDGTTAANSNMAISYGTSNTAVAMTNSIVAATGIIDGNYQEIVGDFIPATSGTYYVGIKGFMNGTPWYISLDDISITESPSCLNPNTIIASNITSNSVDLSWTDGSGGLQFDYEYAIQAPGTGIPAGAGAQVGDVSVVGEGFDINGNPLTPNTLYEVYVRSDCGGGSFSTWSGPITFRTLCSTFVAPYTEGFENGGTIPSCWNMSGSENWLFSNTPGFNHIGNNGVITGSTTSGGYFAWVDDSSPNTTNATLTSPLIDVSALAVPRLTFFELSNNEGANPNSTLNVEVWDGAAWNAMATYNTNTNGWEKRVIDLSTLTITGDIQVRFIIVESSSFYDDIAIDDVTIEETPSCLEPTVFTVNTVGTDSVTVSWTAGATETQWEYVIQAQGTGVPAGAGVSTTSNPLVISGLTPNTPYEIYLRAICSVTEQSIWVGPFNVKTNIEVVCGTPVNTTYCYTDNDSTSWTFTSSDGSPLRVTFNAGQVENTWDELIVLDSDGVTQLYNGYGASGNLTGLTFDSTGDTITVKISSDGSANCGDSAYTPWNFDVVCATCVNPTATYTIVPDCANAQYSIDVDVTNLGTATSVTISDGTTTLPAISALGVQTFGPYADGANTTITITNNQDGACSVNSGVLTNVCPPANDECVNATPIDCGDVVTGTTASGATNSGNNASADVWYSYSGAAGDITVSLCNNTNFDSYLRVFDACGGTQIAFNDDGCAAQSTLTFAANGTSTYYIMVEGFGTNVGNFELSLSCVLSNGDFNSNSFSAYPNPVKDVLNISYATEISSVRVINMIGQEVLSKNVNATSSQVDMSQLSAGTYIVNVTLGDTIKTLKVVKQ